MKVCNIVQDVVWGSPPGPVVKNLPAHAGDLRDTISIPGLGRFPEKAMIKIIRKKKKRKRAKWLSEEALQIAEKRREVKGKGKKERYTNLNAEFQRIARKDKKAFLSDQCKEIEEGFLISPCYSLKLCIQMGISSSLTMD